jgi:hypothetical protein
MGKKLAHVSAPAYWVPSARPAIAPRGVSKKTAARNATQRKLDPKQRARLAAGAKKGGKKGGGGGKGGKKNKR